MQPNSLRISEIFTSLQGESTNTGLLTTFIRLVGCPLRCQYCDTTYAFNGGTIFSIEHVLQHIISMHTINICVTGGEPLAQPNCFILLQMLCDFNYKVSLETSGAHDIERVDPRVMIVMDLKTPDSLEEHRNLFKNLDYLKKIDQIKFVLCSRLDYDWACKIICQYNLVDKLEILFSPSWGQLDPTLLANWIVSDRLPVRLQIQLHKVLWGNAPGV